jgi:phenylpropionate dioxygenase-like ring-hydroxylating dioxygenase large terminal subunit
VTKKECGSSKVLGCRYHGWSYDTRGKLIKAPEFETVPGFDKDVNGLWELPIEIRYGLVFINFDAQGGGVRLDLGTTEPLLQKWNFEQRKCIAEWRVEGDFNWKLLGLYHNARIYGMLTEEQVV